MVKHRPATPVRSLVPWLLAIAALVCLYAADGPLFLLFFSLTLWSCERHAKRARTTGHKKSNRSHQTPPKKKGAHR